MSYKVSVTVECDRCHTKVSSEEVEECPSPHYCANRNEESATVIFKYPEDWIEMGSYSEYRRVCGSCWEARKNEEW